MKKRYNEYELFSVFKTSPLLTEITKIILDSKEGTNVSEIAKVLHKKPPTIHRALRKIQELSLVNVNKRGKIVNYKILPNKKDTVTKILVQLYYPTESYVIGELASTNLNVNVKQNEDMKGSCFIHKFDLVYEYTPITSTVRDIEPESVSCVAIQVFERLLERDILALIGRIFDLQSSKLDGYIVGVIENETSEELYPRLQKLFDTIQDKLDMTVDAILIQKRDPEIGIKRLQKLAEDILKQHS